MGALIIPTRVYSKKQWITLSKRCRAELVEKHRFNPDDFCRVGDDKPSMNWSGMYPREWRYPFKHTEANWLKDSAIPAGLIVHWPRGTDYFGEAYDANDPAYMLADVQYWENFDFEAYHREELENERRLIEEGAS